MPFQPRSRRHRALAPLLATALLALALAAPAVSAIAAGHTSADYPAPNFPTAVPERPGALTGTHPKTPADVTAALAQEHYYSSYGQPTPLTRRPVSDDAGNGIAWLPFLLATSGALIVGIGATSGLFVLHGRRRRATRLA